MEQRTGDPAQTAQLGAALGRVASAGTIIGLIGDLGAGKTLFVQGLARGLDVPAGVRVVSPTFTLINEYRGGRLPVHHVDLYRLEREAELDEIGLDEVLRSGTGVVAVEWADRFAVLPQDALIIELSVAGESDRILTARAGGPISTRVLEAWAAAVASS